MSDSMDVRTVREKEGKTRAMYVGLFNTGERPHAVVVDLVSLGWRGKVRVRDLWKKEEAGMFSRRYSQLIPAHGAALVKITE